MDQPEARKIQFITAKLLPDFGKNLSEKSRDCGVAAVFSCVETAPCRSFASTSTDCPTPGGERSFDSRHVI